MFLPLFRLEMQIKKQIICNIYYQSRVIPFEQL